METFKRRWVMLAALSLSFFTGMTVIESFDLQPPAPNKPLTTRSLKPESSPKWQDVAIFSGTGPATTKTFSIPRGPWRIRWRTDGRREAASFAFAVISAKTADSTLIERSALAVPGRGSITVELGGEDYFLIISAYEASWSLVIEEGLEDR